MKKEEAVLALYDLGCSREEIDDLIHIETLRRKNVEKARKNLVITKIVKEMEISKDEKEKERVMMEEGLYITVKEV